MNKKILVLAIAAATTATSVSAAEIYNDDTSSLTIGGRAEARLSITDGETQDNSRVRINVKGQTKITDNFYGVGFYEGEFKDADNGADDLDNRYIYAGFGGDFGEITYGKNDGSLGVLTDFTDIMAYHGNTAAYKISVADRQGNMLGYAGSYEMGSAGSLDLKLTYAFSDREEKSNGSGYTDNESDGVSTSFIYNIANTGIRFGAGYASQDTEIGSGINKGNTHNAKEYIIALSYEINNLYLAATYTDGDIVSAQVGSDEDVTIDWPTLDDNFDATGYEFAAAYTIEKVVLTTSYNLLTSDDVDDAGLGDDGDVQNNLAFDATYYFNSNFRTYISYNLNLLDDDKVGDIASEDELALGMRYDF